VWVLVAYTYNPSYPRGRDQEDHSSKLTRANCLQDPISKKAHHKKKGGVTQDVSPEFKPQYCKKKKKERKEDSG
jgi:hypothetical protein